MKKADCLAIISALWAVACDYLCIREYCIMGAVAGLLSVVAFYFTLKRYVE